MQLRHEDAGRYLQTHHGVLGAGWKEVQSFDDLEDDDEEYEEEEIEEYITLDLGNGMDGRYLQTEATFQLIGLDTALPHLKIGNIVLQGEVTPLIGSEIILGLIRNQENPHSPSHPPLHATSRRVTFRQIDLWLNNDPSAAGSAAAAGPPAATPATTTSASTSAPGEAGRSMFLQRPAKHGPNRPAVFPGRQRDKIRAENKQARDSPAGSAAATRGPGSPEKPDAMDVDVDVDVNVDVDVIAQEQDQAEEVDVQDNDERAAPDQDQDMESTADMLMNPASPEAGPSQALPSLDMVPDYHSNMFATGPRSSGNTGKIGRPRTRPLLEVHNIEQMRSLNPAILPDNVRILISPLAMHAHQNAYPAPGAPDLPEEVLLAPESMEFTKIQFKRFILGAPTRGRGSRGGPSRPRHSTATATATADMPTSTSTPESKAGQRRPRPSEPFLMTAGVSPRPKTQPQTQNTATATSIAHGSTLAGGVPQEGQGEPTEVTAPDAPEDLEPEARKDVEDIAEAEAREYDEDGQDAAPP